MRTLPALLALALLVASAGAGSAGLAAPDAAALAGASTQSATVASILAKATSTEFNANMNKASGGEATTTTVRMILCSRRGCPRVGAG